MTLEAKPKPYIEKRQRRHAVEAFDCGQDNLNRYLRRYALTNQKSGGAQTYVGVSGEAIMGYYSLVVGQVAYEAAPERLAKGLSRHPVPIMLLARLAVDFNWQGCGVGTGLLRDAMQRTEQAADIAGIRAMLVHAKDTKAKGFYEHFDFIPSPSDPYHLFLLIKDIRKCMGI